MTDVFPVELDDPGAYDHHRPIGEWDPAATHRRMRLACPVGQTSSHGGYWVVTSHDAVRTSARDAEHFSSEHDLDGSRLGQEFGGIGIPPQRQYRSIPSEIDGAAFHQYRRLLLPWFTPDSAQDWGATVRSFAADCLAPHLRRGAMDLVLDLANPVPAMVTLALVGLDTDQWHRYAEPLHSLVYAEPSSPARAAALDEVGRLRAALLEVVMARRTAPCPDLATTVVNGIVEGEPVSDSDAVNVLFAVVSGGVDTTTALIANALRWLSVNPGVRQRLIDDRALRSQAREEFLRVFSPAPATARTTTGPVRLAGQTLDRGERVLLSWTAANRDPAVFLDPDVVDIDRDAQHHVAFGFGPHRCIGAPLARVTFDAVLDVVLDGIGDYAVDLEAAVRYPRVGAVNGWSTMPATFTPH
jgi:cytochrome P450